MDKLKMHSIDGVDKNIEMIGKLFPNVITERKNEKGEVERAIDFDILRQELSKSIVEGNEERYQFIWPDKKKSILLANSPIAATLRPCPGESVNFDTTENLYIEGDNLDVLKLMQETYLGKVKMIYIDPPYNTGKDSFVYNDNFDMTSGDFYSASGLHDENGNMLFDIRENNESNGKFHTDWLNMLYPRLKLSKNILADDGIILINMDENEISNLQKICNEIFGEQNDLGTIIWDKRNPKGDAKGISYQHEYIIVYAKDKAHFLQKCKMQRPKKNAEAMLKKAKQLFEQINLTYTLEQAQKDFSLWLNKQTDLSGGERAYCKIDEKGEVYRPVSMAWPNKQKAPDNYFIPLIHPVTGKPCPVPDRGWRNPPETMQLMMKTGRILFGKDESTIPNSKYLLKENMYENIPSLIYFGGSDTDMLEEINVPFETPKVVDICKEHIKSFTSSDDIILDFFAGSSTIAHAVMQANAEDEGKRQFIMVQIPEPCDNSSALKRNGFQNICQAGITRIAKSGQRIKKNMELLGGTLDVGFRVLKLDSTNVKDIYYNPADFKQDMMDEVIGNIKEDRTTEDLLFQVMLELGILLSSKIQSEVLRVKSGVEYKYFNVADNFLIACFDENVNEEVVKAIAQKKPYYAVLRDSSLSSDSVATNFDQIFATYSPDTVRRVL